MKKIIAGCLIFLMAISSTPLIAEDIQTLGDQTDALYREGAGAQDGAFTALSTSMLGWGLGLAAGIAILAGVLHQSKNTHEHTTCH